MAKLNFRHGIVRRQEDGFGSPTFLQQSGGGSFIDLIVSPDPTIFTIAHLDEDYLFTENTTIPGAWGPFTSGTDYYLFWDIDFITGILSRGFSLLEPIVSPTPPPSPFVDQHWFDTSTFVMKRFNGSMFVEVLRLFVAKYQNGTTIIHKPLGTQIGISGGSIFAGSPLFDPQGNPVQKFRRDRKGQFITTETPLASQLTTFSNFVFEGLITQAQAVEPIPANFAVAFFGTNEIGLARSTVPNRPAVGLAKEDMATGEIRPFITRGFVSDEVSFNFTEPAGTPLFVGVTGDLTSTAPVADSQQQIAVVVDPTTIFVEIRQLVKYSDVGILVPLHLNRTTGALVTEQIDELEIPIGTVPTFGFVHNQAVAATTWTIVHNLNTDDGVIQVYNLSNQQIIPDTVTFLDANTVEITFFTAQTGKACLAMFVSP